MKQAARGLSGGGRDFFLRALVVENDDNENEFYRDDLIFMIFHQNLASSYDRVTLPHDTHNLTVPFTAAATRGRYQGVKTPNSPKPAHNTPSHGTTWTLCPLLP